MHDLETLRTVLARLEAATGADRELDAAIYRALAGSPTRHWFAFGDGYLSDETVPTVTASIDAAVALVERAMAGEMPEVVSVIIAIAATGCARRYPGKPPSEALARAVCIELFRALITKETAR